jgi:hypothetical protein
VVVRVERERRERRGAGRVSGGGGSPERMEMMSKE